MRTLLLALVVAGLTACSGLSGDDSADTAGEPYERVLVDEAYRFCHVDGADPLEAREYCSLLASNPDDFCPGLRATCDGADEGEVTDIDDFGGCNGASSGRESDGMAAPPEKPREPVSCDAPEWEAPQTGGEWALALLRWGAAFGVALVVLVVIRLVLMFVGTGGDAPEAPKVVAVARQTVPTPDEVPEAPSRDQLDDARQALADGRYADVVLIARGASLRALAEQGFIRLHRARTDREYRRRLKNEPHVHDPLALVLQAVEAQRWGGVPPDRARASSVLEAAARVLATVAPIVLAVLLLGASADRYRYGPDGDAGVYDVFTDYGYDTSWRLRGLASIDDDVDVLVLDIARVHPDEADWAALRGWVESGGVLIVSGDASAGIPELGTYEVHLTQRAMRLHDGVAAYSPMPVLPEGGLAAYADPGGLTWLSVDGSAVIQSYLIGTGGIVAIADVRLLRNGSLVHPDNEMFLGTLLWAGLNNGWWEVHEGDSVQLATMSASGADNPVSSLLNANILPFVAQLLAFLALAGLWRGWPFRPLRDPPDEGRQRFADHLTALAHRWEQLGAVRFAVSRYAELWLVRLGRGGLINAAVRHGKSRAAATAWVDRVEAVAAAPTEQSTDAANDTQLMEELWTITRPKQT